MTVRTNLHHYLPNREFVIRALSVMAPIVIQQMINTLFGVVDSLMVGRLDALSMAAVAVANKPALIYNGVFFGITGGAGILISQYFGAGDRAKCQGLFSLEVLLGLTFSAFFCALLFLFPKQLMGLFVSDATTIDLGSRYMRAVCLSYVASSLSMVCIYAMRAIGHNRLPMVLSMLTMGLNAVLNYAFIFGKLGAPALGVEGAALGTVISRTVEMALYFLFLSRGHMYFRVRLKDAFSLPRAVLVCFVRRVAPLTINEILYATGVSMYFWSYARIDETAVPALSIADQALQLGMVLSMGMSSVVGVMVGALLGAGDFEGAKSNAKKLLTITAAITLVSSLVACVGAFALPGRFNISPDMQALATRLTLILVLFYPFNAIYSLGFFLLRAGGDTRATLILDSGILWALPIPLGVVLASLPRGSVSIEVAFMAVQAAQTIRLFVSYYFIKRGHWIRNITLES